MVLSPAITSADAADGGDGAEDGGGAVALSRMPVSTIAHIERLMIGLRVIRAGGTMADV